MIISFTAKFASTLKRRLQSKLGETKRQTNSRRIRLEQLESRQMMAGDMLGAVSHDGVFKLDLQGGGVPEIDRRFGATGDKFVVGDWLGKGHDQLGAVHTRADGFLEWRLNFDESGDSTAERSFIFGLVGDIPVVGDWDGNGADNVGVVRRNPQGGLTWYFDLNFDPNPERTQDFGLHGDTPVVGDWDNNGSDNVGVVRNRSDNFLDWHLDTTGDAWPEVTRLYGIKGDTPVVGDWNQDGRIDIGVTRLAFSRLGTELHWYRDINGDSLADLPIIAAGYAGDTPVVGKWRFSEVFVTVKDGVKQVPVVDGQAGSRSVQFGTVYQNSFVRKEFTISNKGSAPLSLGTLNVPRGWTSTSVLPKSLPAGSSTTFLVEMDTSFSGAREGQISFTTNDGNESIFNFVIRGHVVTTIANLQFSGQGQFGSVVRGESATGQFTLTNTGSKAVNYKVVSDNTTDFSVIAGASGTIAANGGTVSIVVRMNTSSLGTKQANLIASALDGSNISTRISLTGQVASAPTVPAPTLTGNGNFGSVPVGATGTTIRRTFVLANPSAADISYSASLSNTDFRLLTLPSGKVPARGQVSIIVEMNTSSVKSLASTLRVNTGGTNPMTLTKSLTGQVTRELYPADVGIRIGETTVPQGQPGLLYYGASSSSARVLEFRIFNSGEQNLRITNPQISGMFSHDLPAVLDVAGGTSKVIRVTMNSGTLGTKVGTLTFNTNDTKETAVRINLLGRQLAPVVQAAGSATSLPNGILTIHSPTSPIFVDHANGPTSIGGTYKVSSGSSALSYTSSLTKIVIISSTRPVVENWADGVAVIWQRPTVNGITPAPITLPRAIQLNWFS